VPQFGKLSFEVPVHECVDRDRVILKAIRVHVEFAVLDDPPSVDFGFEHSYGTDDFSSLPIAARLAFPPNA
jgi:hypothetical protein